MRDQNAGDARDDATVTPQRSPRRVRLLAVGLCAVWLVACASNGGDATTGAISAATSSSGITEPTATAPVATAAPSTTRPSGAPTTTADQGPTGHYEPACHDQATEREPAGPADDPALDTLGAVGDHPALEIALPVAVADADGTMSPPTAGEARIPGGLLVTVAGPSTNWFPGGMVAAVDLDGVVRWVRCTTDSLAGAVIAPLDTHPDRMLLGTSRWNAQLEVWTSSWDVVSLADGSTLDSIDGMVDAAGVADDRGASNRTLVLSQDGVAVFAPDSAHVIDTDIDGLLRVDLDTWTVSTTTLPPEFDGHPAGELQLGLGTDGSLLRMGQLVGPGVGVPQSVEVDGAWVTDEALRRAVWGPTVGYTFGDSGARVASWDAIGSVRWTSESSLPSREGFSFSAQDDVVVYVACDELDGTSPCPDERLVGLDPDTGRERWSLPGWRIVGPVGDGVAYVTDSVDVMAGEQPSGWYVLDTTTGEVADTPTWPGVDTFLSECCGGYDYQHTDTLGGIVVVVSGQVMRVWFPAALTPPAPTQVALT